MWSKCTLVLCKHRTFTCTFIVGLYSNTQYYICLESSNPIGIYYHTWGFNLKKGETSLVTELERSWITWWEHQHTVGTSQCVLKSRRMGSSTSMPTWFLTALTHILRFLDRRHNVVTAEDQTDIEQMRCIVICNLQSALVHFLSSSSHHILVINLNEEFLLLRQRKVYNLQAYARIPNWSHGGVLCLCEDGFAVEDFPPSRMDRSS